MTRHATRIVLATVSALALTAGLTFAAPEDKPARDAETPRAQRQRQADERPATRPAQDRVRRGRKEEAPATRPAADRERRGERKADERSGRGTPEQQQQAMWRQLLGNLDLNDRQERRVRKAIEAHREQREAWWKEHRDQIREVREQLREARHAEDQEKLKQIREQARELMQTAPQHETLYAQLDEVLNDKQMERLKKNWQRMREHDGQKEDRQEGDRRERGERERSDRDRGDRDRSGREDAGRNRGEMERRGDDGEGPRERRNRRPREREDNRDQPQEKKQEKAGDQGTLDL